jgi:TetR/AcrR family transcriptional regulator
MCPTVTAKPPSTKAQQSADTREAILTSALCLFARHGVAGASIDQIAQAAGITKGAVYWHFDSKDALFDAILDRIRVRWQETVHAPLSQKTTAATGLEALFSGYTALFTETPEICLFMQRVLLEGDREFSPKVGRIFSQTARAIAKILEEGRTNEFREDLDTIATAHTILGSISGASQQSLANRSLTIETLLNEAREMTLARVRR